MSAGYGFAGHIGFALENSGNTPVAATNFIQALNESLTVTLDRFETVNIAGRFAEPDDSDGVKRINGDIVFAVNPVDIAFFLKGTMGVTSTTAVASGVLWENRYTMRTADFDNKFPQNPFTFEVFRDVGSAQRYSGINMTTLSFNVSPNQDLRATVTMVGVDETDISASTPSFTNSPVEVLAFDTASISLAGAANVNIESMTINIDNLLEGIPTLANTKLINKIRRTNFQQIRVSGDIGFEDIVEYNKFKSQSEQAIKLSLFRANSFSLVLDMPRVVYTAFPLGIGGRERQVVSFEGTARFHTGSNQAIEAILTTTRSGP